MARIILSLEGVILKEMRLSKERLTIGRRPHNDIVIDDLAISGEHATIIVGANDVFVEDLNSTNGTQVNGQPVRKHFLQDNDVIQLANYTIRYLGRALKDGETGAGNASPASRTHHATIKMLNGPNAGTRTAIAKTITTIGRSDSAIATIAKRHDRYFILHIKGGDSPKVNGKEIGSSEHPVLHGDVIDIAGTEMRFLLD